MPCRLQLPRLRIIKIYENITQISAHLRKRLSVSVSGLLNITELEKRTQASTSQRKNICHHPEPSENAFGDKFEGILKTLMCREISSLKEFLPVWRKFCFIFPSIVQDRCVKPVFSPFWKCSFLCAQGSETSQWFWQLLELFKWKFHSLLPNILFSLF